MTQPGDAWGPSECPQQGHGRDGKQRRPVPLYQGLRPGQGTALERAGRPARRTSLRGGDGLELSQAERMTRYLDLLAEVLWPDGTCAACRDSRADRCPQHTQDLADHEAVLAAIKAVEDAETEEQALDAYRSCPTGLVESEKAEGRGAS